MMAGSPKREQQSSGVGYESDLAGWGTEGGPVYDGVYDPSSDHERVYLNDDDYLAAQGREDALERALNDPNVLRIDDQGNVIQGHVPSYEDYGLEKIQASATGKTASEQQLFGTQGHVPGQTYWVNDGKPFSSLKTEYTGQYWTGDTWWTDLNAAAGNILNLPNNAGAALGNFFLYDLPNASENAMNYIAFADWDTVKDDLSSAGNYLKGAWQNGVDSLKRVGHYWSNISSGQFADDAGYALLGIGKSLTNPEAVSGYFTAALAAPFEGAAMARFGEIPGAGARGLVDDVVPKNNPAAGPVNFMEETDRFFLNASKRSDIDPDGYFDVVAHGSPNKIQIETLNGPVLVDHRTAARLIEQQPGYNGQNIRLFSCSTGACDTGFAQNLANKLNVEVQAPTDLLWAYPNGKTVVAPKGLDGLPDLSNVGEIKIFQPKKSQ
jgi:hypothetical protein